MNNIVNYIKNVDKRRFRGNKISVHLYHPKLNQHLLLFGYFIEKNFLGGKTEYCHILCSPSTIDKNLSYSEISTIEISNIDNYYDNYEIKTDSDYLNKDYKLIKKKFEQLQS